MGRGFAPIDPRPADRFAGQENVPSQFYPVIWEPVDEKRYCRGESNFQRFRPFRFVLFQASPNGEIERWLEIISGRAMDLAFPDAFHIGPANPRPVELTGRWLVLSSPSENPV